MAESSHDIVKQLRPVFPAPPIRVLVCGEQPIALLGLAQLIDGAPQRVTRIATASHFYELNSHPALIDSEVVCLDLGLRLASSIRFLPDLIADMALKVVVLVEDSNFAQHEDAVASGALGVVMKSRPTSEVLDAIERVHAGEAWVNRTLMASLIKHRSVRNGMPPRADDEQSRRIAGLTAKERQVIEMVVAHRGAKGLVVAESLGISEQTLRNRLSCIYDKLGIRGKLDLYLYALSHGLGPVRAEGDVAAGHLAAR